MEFIKELLFPKFCVTCRREGSYLCSDCLSLIDFLPYSNYRSKNLNGLLAVAPYSNFIIKKLIVQFKYQPFIKDLSTTLAYLIIHYINLIEKQTFFSDKNLIIPIPLAKRRFRERGFNQSEEIGKKLSEFLKIPMLNNVLFKIKETQSQVELSKEEREKNIKNVFLIKNSELIEGKKILLLDDVYTTGSTMEEAAKVLKESGAKQVFGIVVARE
jgi:ComF family protein